eukprot:jgi/Chlat1/1358/Chrsp119S01779
MVLRRFLRAVGQARLLQRYHANLSFPAVVEAAAHLHKAVNKSPAQTRIAVAISGGVDSSVAALLFKQQGYNVFGVHMRNWDESEERGSACLGEKEYADAQRVCEQLQMPLHHVSFVRQYWHHVFEDFLNGHARGVTPNPDLACNRHIKFDALLQHALTLGADALATGHYARLRMNNSNNTVSLIPALDASKDQTYFLATVRQSALQKAAFPLGGLHKAEVRAIAKAAGLPTAEKRSSVGICFIGKRDFADFIGDYVDMKPGRFVSVSGQDLGAHKGLAAYTCGQRARIGGAPHAWYVAGKDPAINVVYLAPGGEDAALYSTAAVTEEFTWMAGHPPATLPVQPGWAYKCKVRYSENFVNCSIVRLGASPDSTLCDGVLASSTFSGYNARTVIDFAGSLGVLFERPVRGVTPGQALVLYASDGACLGSAPIRYQCRTLHEQNGTLVMASAV